MIRTSLGLGLGLSYGLTDSGAEGGPTLGPVATGTYFPNNFYQVGSVGVNSLAPFWATEELTTFKLAFVNACANNETGSGFVEEHTTNAVALNMTCTLEYPTGVFTRVKKGGVNTMPLAIGELMLTDDIVLSVPAGAKVMVHCYWEKQGGGTVYVPAAYFIGDADFYVNEFTPNDRTGALSYRDTVFEGNVGWHFGPAAVLAETSARTFALVGDSRTLGVQDTISDSTKCAGGEVGRALNAYGTLNLGIGNDRASKFLLSNTLRRQLAGYCTDIVLGYGANDIYFDSAATILSNSQTIRNYWPDKPCYLYTLPPVGVSSSDDFATLANQTLSWTEPVRAGYNDLLRAGVAWAADVWEVADVLESSRNSGKWRIDLGLVNGKPTGDPTHENALGNSTIATSGAITP